MDARVIAVFDLDGTLADTAEGIVAGLGAALSALGVSGARPVDRSLVGPKLGAIAEALLPKESQATKAAFVEKFKEIYDKSAGKSVREFAEMGREIERLSGRGARLWVATNKRRLPAEAVLLALGWGSAFERTFCSDDAAFAGKREMLCAVRKEAEASSPKPTLCVYVGDRREDELAAAGQMEFIRAGWGYGEQDWAGAEEPLTARRPGELGGLLDLALRRRRSRG